jgi:glycosyltransferase involved in cell wall biosynthesis
LKSTVDVLIAIRGPAPFLRFTLQSILGQSIESAHVIAVLDGSSDEVEDLLLELLPKATLLHVPPNSGVAHALNAGLKVSTANYIARIDADDMMNPTRLDLQRDYLDAHPTCVAVSSAVTFINELGSKISHRAPPTGDDKIRRRLQWRNPIAHPATTLRRETVVDLGGYSEHAKYLEDFVLWLNLATKGEIATLPDSLTKYRVHDGQVTKSVKFDSIGMSELRRARVAFARSQDSSVTAARYLHFLWYLVQVARGRIALGK